MSLQILKHIPGTDANKVLLCFFCMPLLYSIMHSFCLSSSIAPPHHLLLQSASLALVCVGLQSPVSRQFSIMVWMSVYTVQVHKDNKDQSAAY